MSTETMDLTTAAEPISIPDAFAALRHWTDRAAEDKAEIDRIDEEAKREAAAYVLRYDEAQAEITQLKAQIEAAMEAQGITTVEGSGLQAQRPKKTRTVITNLDIACAHLADLGRLPEVQRLVVDQQAVLRIAEYREGGLDGVETQTSRGFRIVKSKG